jgi:hypothetical protein
MVAMYVLFAGFASGRAGSWRQARAQAVRVPDSQLKWTL